MPPPPEIFLNGAIWCALVHIWIRFCLFLYIKKNILDTRLLCGISHKNIFENILRSPRFRVYFEFFKK